MSSKVSSGKNADHADSKQSGSQGSGSGVPMQDKGAGRQDQKIDTRQDSKQSDSTGGSSGSGSKGSKGKS